MNKLFLLGALVIFTIVTTVSCVSIDASRNESVDNSRNEVAGKSGDNSLKESKKELSVTDTSFQKNKDAVKNKDDVAYRIIATSAYSNMPYPQGIYIARSLEDAIAISEGNEKGVELFSTIDFKKEALLFVFAGQFNTGGYTISVDLIKRVGKKKVFAQFSVLYPPMDSIVTQAITTPSMIVAIEVKKTEVISAFFAE